MKISEAQIDNLVGLLDGYAEKGGHHLNVNVFTKIRFWTLRHIRRSIRSLRCVCPDTRSTSTS